MESVAYCFHIIFQKTRDFTFKYMITHLLLDFLNLSWQTRRHGRVRFYVVFEVGGD